MQPDILEQAVDDALAADLAWHRAAPPRGGSWGAVPREQVRRLLEGAFPGLVAAAVRAAAEMERAEAAEAKLAAPGDGDG